VDPQPALFLPLGEKEQRLVRLADFFRELEEQEDDTLDVDDPVLLGDDNLLSLEKKEIQLETGAVARAVRKYRATLRTLNKIGKASQMKPSQTLITKWYTPLYKAIVSEQEAVINKPLTKADMYVVSLLLGSMWCCCFCFVFVRVQNCAHSPECASVPMEDGELA
jgi:hypothetical protein